MMDNPNRIPTSKGDKLAGTGGEVMHEAAQHTQLLVELQDVPVFHRNQLHRKPLHGAHKTAVAAIRA